ncbi:MAG: alpha/beta hydrolase [Asgard group archaeon]|nr:alpha/beta hydrolase [Asgard group archaeon]
MDLSDVQEKSKIESFSKNWDESLYRSEDLIPMLTVTNEQKQTVEQIIQSVKQPINEFWSKKDCKILYIPVENGEIRITQHKPEKPIGIRPILFIAGWSSCPEIFQDFYEFFFNRVEFYFLETREKGSSRLTKKRARISMEQNAKDVRKAIEYLQLDQSMDFILMGSCWGSSIILDGLIRKEFTAPTIITYDPMYKLWFSRFLLKYIFPFLPVFVIRWIKNLVQFFSLRKRKNEIQAQRLDYIFNNCDLRKWKNAAIPAKDFYLFGRLSKIDEEIFIFAGTEDNIHDKRYYPPMTKEMPKGRFFYMETDESNREFLMAAISLEFSKIKSSDGVPEILADFEKKIDRI